MQFRSAFLVAIIPAALAAQRQTPIHPTSAIERGSPSSTGLISGSVNFTETLDTITQGPNPVTTVATEKPALEASVMGLIVFSAAGLYLL
ncbi:hypothetical protein F5X96DRAFT_7683 [Biscogniauxia mediterranea]|nr:hypothetical protein F5X96DRAFT_7683 [Biscogniauxia mediterranea]